MRRSKRAVAIACVTVAAVALLGCSAVVKRIATMTSAIQLSAECMTEEQQGHPKAALQDCNAALSLEPSFSLMYYDRATVYNVMGDRNRALQDLDHAIRLQPALADPWAMRCRIHMMRGPVGFTAAESACDEAVRLDSRKDTGLYARLALRTHMRDYQGALADARSLAALHPGSALGYLPTCEVYVAMQRYADARRSCAQAENAPKDRIEGYMSGAIFATEMGAWQHAATDADGAVKLDPQSAEAYNNRCWVRIRMNDVHDATVDCALALALSDNSPHIRDTRADIRIREHDYAGVIDDEDAMIEGFPGSPYGYGGRCAAEQKMGELGRALADCRHALKLDPFTGEWYVLLGNVYRAQGDPSSAQLMYEGALSNDPSAFDAVREEAQLAMDRGDARSAAQLAASYVSKNEYDPVGREVYGRALAMLGDDSHALAQLDAAMRGYQQRHDSSAREEVATTMAQLQGKLQTGSQAPAVASGQGGR